MIINTLLVLVSHIASKGVGFTLENHLGVRNIWDDTGTGFRPYVGVGIAVVSDKLELETGATKVEEDDTGTGFWLGAGTYWTAGPKLNMDFDIRYSQADVTLFNKERDAGGLHTGLFVGYHW